MRSRPRRRIGNRAEDPHDYRLARPALALFAAMAIVMGSLTFQAPPASAFSIDFISTLKGILQDDPGVGNHEQISRVAIKSATAPNSTSTLLDQVPEIDTVILNLQRSVENTDITHQFDCDSHMDDSSATALPDPPGPPMSITGIAGAAGLIRITAPGHGFNTGDTVDVSGVVGAVEANKTGWVVNVIDANTFDLQGSAFVNAYVSGGAAAVEHYVPQGQTAGWWNRKYNCDGGLGFIADFQLLWDRISAGLKSGGGNQQFLHPTFSSFLDIVTFALNAFRNLGASGLCAANSGCAVAAAQATAYALDYTDPVTKVQLDANPSPDPFPVTNPDSPFANGVPASLQPCGPCGVAGGLMQTYRDLVYGLQQDLQIILFTANRDPLCNCLRTLDEILGSSDQTTRLLHVALDQVNAYIAFQYIGHALHTAEDFFAHSNYIELMASQRLGVTIDPGLFGGGGIGVTGLAPSDMRALVPSDFSQFTYANLQTYMGSQWSALQTGAIFANILHEGDFCLSPASIDHGYNPDVSTALFWFSVLTGILVPYTAGSNPNPPYGFKYCHYNTATTTGLNKDEYDPLKPSATTDPCGPPTTIDISKLSEPEHVNFFYACVAAEQMASEMWTYVRDHLGPTTSARSTSSVDTSGQQHIVVHLKAEDTSGHSVGIQKIDWSLTGAQSGSGSITGAEGDVDVSAPGTTVVHFHATDGNGTEEKPEKKYAVKVSQGSNTSYSYNLIAQTGGAANVPGGNDTFATFGIGPSINDIGTVAFSAYHQGTSTTGGASAGNGLFVKHAGLPVANVNPSYSVEGDRRFDDFPQINMSDEVIAGDVLFGSPPTYKIRVWDARPGIANRFQTLDSNTRISNCSANSGTDANGKPVETGTVTDPTTGTTATWTAAGLNGYGVGNLPDFLPGATCESDSLGYDSVVGPGINNGGGYFYSGLGGGSWNIEGPGLTVASLQSFFKPSITDSGAIVTRHGGVEGTPPSAPPDPIILYGGNNAGTIACATGCGHPGFVKLGAAPSASGDDQIVVFEGDYEGSNAGYGPPGPGIFAMIMTNNNGWVIQRIASVGDGGITSFDGIARVGVQSTQAAKRTASIVFTAYGPNSERGIYVAHLNFIGSSDGSFNVNQPTHGFTVDKAQLVVGIGSGITGLGAVTGLQYGTNPINNHGVGEIVFWAASGNQQAVVVASPNCSGSYAVGSLANSTYINAYSAGPGWNLPVAASTGLQGGNACGPSSVAMAWNMVKHARGNATSDGAMADLAAMYGTGAKGSGMMLKVVNGQFVNGIIHNGDRAGWSAPKAQGYLASKGWVSAVGKGQAFIDQQLALGNLVVASTTFGVGAQPVPAHSTYGTGHIVLFLGKTPNGDYIVNDAAGDFFFNPVGGAINDHYGAVICGEAVVYPSADVARNLVQRDHSGNPIDANGNVTTVAAAAGRQVLSISYVQNADPEVLVVTGFFSGSNGRPYSLRLTNSAGQTAGFLPNGSTTTDIPGSFAALDEGSPDDVTETTSQAISPQNFLDTVSVVNPGTDLTAQLQGTASGNYTIEYTRFKDGQIIDEGTVTGTISAGATRSIPVVRSPLATAQTVLARQETPRSIQLAGTDPAGRPLTVAVATQPVNGALSAVDPNGNVTYTPSAGYTGTDSFTFTTSNGVITSTPATVTITVNPNTPPVAFNSTAATDENQPVQVTLTGSAPSGQPLTFAAGQPSNGTVNLTGSTATYTPTKYFYGTDSFTFTVNDNYITSTTATITVTVRHVNQAPVVTLTAPQSVNEGSAPAPITANITYPDGDPSTLQWSTTAGNIVGTGTSVTFAADDGPATATVSLTATTSHGVSSTATATIHVLNVAPSATPGSAQAQYWGLPVTVTGIATDPSGADTTAGLNPTWNFGDATATAQGYSTTHTYANPGSYGARLTATDKDGGAGSGTVAVTVNKRGSSLSYAGSTSAPFGFVTLSAKLTDSVDGPSARLAGHKVTFLVGTQAFAATTDSTGTATVIPAPIAPGSYSVAVVFSADSLYLSSSARATLVVSNSAGNATGTGLVPATGGSASFNITSTGTTISGTLDYSNGTTVVHATSLAPFGIRPDGHAAWFYGVDTLGRKITVYVEDNGSGPADVFKLSINGVAQTGTGALTGGTIQVVKS